MSNTGRRRPLRRALRVVCVLCGALAIVWILLGRLPSVARPASSAPAFSYADAIARFDSIRARDGAEVNSECRPRILAAGARTERVIVLLHGFTNCPKQFDSLAKNFARLGHNVLLPRLPRHGMADRMSAELGLLTAEDLVRAGEGAIDIAQGLGEHVTVVGLSSSAVLAAWLAQHSTDIDCAVILAPSFAPHGVPAPVARRLASALLRLPSFFLWWDPRLRADLPGPKQSYPRFATRALAEVYRLGFQVLGEADRGKPAAEITLVTSAADDVVNNDLALELARRWRSRGADVRTFEFPASQHVHHDMIDPEQPYQRVRVTYPIIEELTLTVGGLPQSPTKKSDPARHTDSPVRRTLQ